METNVCSIDSLIAQIEAEAAQQNGSAVLDKAVQTASTTSTVLPAEHINAALFNDAVNRCEMEKNVVSENPTDCRIPIFGAIISAFRKILRKMLRFYILPIVNQQNVFNASVADALSALRSAYGKDVELEGRIDTITYAGQVRQKSDMSDMRRELDALKASNEALAAEVAALRKQAKKAGGE